jgi:hypothetical protein
MDNDNRHSSPTWTKAQQKELGGGQALQEVDVEVHMGRNGGKLPALHTDRGKSLWSH